MEQSLAARSRRDASEQIRWCCRWFEALLPNVMLQAPCRRRPCPARP